jgi:hypothetical protein
MPLAGLPMPTAASRMPMAGSPILTAASPPTGPRGRGGEAPTPWSYDAYSSMIRSIARRHTLQNGTGLRLNMMQSSSGR